ncbi:efflux RND transporter periplasmic adaptor subunit [Rhodomicrobium sp. Az07]|uniref:efflux RND transporter periplasmic adaptor subunit n=1 Tax=Rhodomicrobium sp. Az07 TaxID=2839034 RepID=UPI001BE85CA1|nr:efflux RND transporter periplasmic adaptor subunit [Rhodomicrobium sp. Az07]MBT3069292.1 efflux RND transporter periplasmic adaptor subunit [Rhodomicrobium sp. Az07]
MRAPLLAIAAAALLVGACDAEKATTSIAAPPPEVGVLTVTEAPITLTKELPGRVTPIRVAEVRPRVGGIVVERTFQQGSVVKAGAVLYRIDPAQFQVELDRAKAALAKAEAVALQTTRQEGRLRTLLRGQTTTQAQYDLALAARQQAEADVAAQKAAVEQATLNLDYATVRAPITGRIGRALVTEGALVGRTEATHLATIQQLDPIYADFTQSVSEVNDMKRALADGQLSRVSPDTAKVRLLFDDGSAYAFPGRLLFSDVTVDPGTAKVTLRGEFPNPKSDLLPGMYVRVVIDEAIDIDGIAVPAQAVRRTDSGVSAVFVVNDSNRAILQSVRVGRTIGGRVTIEDGLKPGYKIVVDGFQKFTPGDRVKPVPFSERPITQASAR